MLWVLIGIIFFILGCIALKEINTWEGVFLPLFLISGVAISLPIAFGITTYPNLMGEFEAVVSLHEEIKTVKEAHYSGISSGELVGGSLDNLQQSKMLSEYIKNYAEKKAGFNCILKKAQIRQKLKFYHWFLDGRFIDKRVQEVQRVK